MAPFSELQSRWEKSQAE